MNKYTFTASICLATLLSACGGGSSTTTTPTTPPSPPGAVLSISSVTPDRLMFGRPTRFTVVGTALDRGLTLTSAGCGSITPATGGTATQQTITCTPTATGSISLTFSLAGLATPFVSTQAIPLPRATLKTTLGDIVVEMFPANAPVTVNNFLQYVNEGFYNGLIFHRVIPGFVIQGGGFNINLQQILPRAGIKLESRNGLNNVRGTIAMARTSDPNSANSQFFFNVVDNPFLNGNTAGVDGFAVFGQIVTGLSVMDAISVVPTSTRGSFGDVPITAVVINTVTQTQ